MEQGVFDDEVADDVSQNAEDFSLADMGTTRVMQHVMGQIEAVLALLRATPVAALTRRQRAAIAATLERTAALLRRS